MSKSTTVIHLRLYALCFWYSRSRRYGDSRIKALRSAWVASKGICEFVPGSVIVGGLSINVPDHPAADPNHGG